MWAAAKFALSGILGPAWLAKLIGGVAVLMAVFAGYITWKHKIYTEGWNAHVQAIAEENAEALAQQRKVLATVADCKRNRMRYDQTSGKCGGPL